MIETLKYRSDGPTPSLADSLAVTKAYIHIEYKRRVESRLGATVAESWNSMCDWLGEKQNNASRLARLLGDPLMSLDASHALSVASAFWVEAAISNDSGDPERSWAALLQSQYYLGMASGPETVEERAARGGVARKENYAPLRRLLLSLLAECDIGCFMSAREARSALLPRLKAFCNTTGQGRSTSPDKLMQDWSKSDSEVRSAFGRVVRGGLKRGRKKLSAGT